jgi:SSS family solute:Na+ symporter
MGTVLFLIAVAISKIGGINPFLILSVVTIVLTLVNLKGGIQAVIWLDVFQGFMLFASGIICLVTILFSIKGGVSEAIKIATENNRTGFGPYDIDFTRLTLIVMIINGAFYAIQKYGTDQTVVQRYLTARTDRSAIRASLLGISLTVPVWIMFMLIGTALFVFYKQHPLPANTKAEEAFPYFMITQLPTGVAGFIVAALVSAAICSLSADLNSNAAVGVEDYYKKFKPGRSDKHYLYASKVMIIISGIMAGGIGALYLVTGNEGVLGVIFTLYAIFSGGIVGIFLLGFLSARANRQGVNIGIIACILFTAWALLTSVPVVIQNKKVLLDLGRFNFTHHTLMLGVYSHLIVIIVGYIASLFFPKPDLDRNLLYSTQRQNKKSELYVP